MVSARFPFLQVDAPASRAEELGARLFELGAKGVELRDETTLVRGPGPEEVRLVATFATVQEADKVRLDLTREEAGLRCVVDELVGDEWRDKYKEYFSAFALTPSVLVAPPWEEPAVPVGSCLLVLDPGRAFGTGLHATTALVATEMEDKKAAFLGEPVLDVGTGSGILALLALQLGAASATAIDCDPEAIAVATDNAKRNGLLSRTALACVPLSEVAGQYAAVLANIEARVLEGMASELVHRLRPGGLLILSGVLAEQKDGIEATYLRAAQRSGVQLEYHHTLERGDGPDGWVAITFQRVMA